MSLTKLIPIREALEREDMLGHALPGDSFRIHRTLLIAMMGEALTDDERELFHSVTGREREPGFQVDEAHWILGRRAGKTVAAGALSAYVATLCDHSWHDKGRVVLPIMAGSTVQANVSFQAVLSALEKSPILSKQIESQNTEVIRLRNNVDIAVRPASFRTIRGISAPMICADELSTWQVDEHSANADIEILNAARPALATSGGLLFAYSSPWAKRGELWNAFKRNYGPNGDPSILVAKAASRTMNPTLPQRVVDRAYEQDSFRAQAEYGAEFRDGISQLLTAEIVDAAVDSGVFERPYEEKTRYVAFVDPSGGSSDSFTLSIAHADGKVALVDVLREVKPPFSPEAVVDEFCALLRDYKITTVTGDRYAGEWPREQFRKRGIEYRLSSRTASEIFNDSVALFNSSCIALVDHPGLVTQLTQLERRVSRGGKPNISHPPHGHDDAAVAVCGAALLVMKPTATTSFAGYAPLFSVNGGALTSSPVSHADHDPAAFGATIAR